MQRRMPGAPVKLAGIELPRVLADALGDCRPHFIAAAGFSLLINILYLAPTLYMLQAAFPSRRC
jgi:ABC-type protease/lipase transport system fused ATPase/permease subunit